MSQNKRKNNTEKGKKKRVPASVLFTRILAIVLCVLMLIGSIIFALQFILNVRAVENSGIYQVETDDVIVRVGMMYGSDVTVGFETTTEYGHVFGAVSQADDCYSKLWQTGTKVVSVTCDANLSKSAMTYSLASSPSDTVIGGYHLQLMTSYATESEASGMVSYLRSFLSAYQVDVFPAYCDGFYRIRVGDYASGPLAWTSYDSFSSVLGGLSFELAAPSETAVSVVDPYTDSILFEFDSDGMALGLYPVQSGEEVSYLKTPAKNLYGGIFEYTRSPGGVTVINIIELEEYIEGVLPWEISNNWPMEAQKTFAIVIRSLTLVMQERHMVAYGKYNFDVCNSTHCQAYRGRLRVNDDILEAVRSTEGLVVAYENDVARTYYSAISGGVTVSSKEAWGGSDYPYLQAIVTPWENYNSYSNGHWTVEISPEELYKILTNAGYTDVKGNIADVTINSFCRNSTYVYSITFTDIYGNKETIEQSDRIRGVLTSFLKSANFVVAKAGETVEISEYIVIEDTGINVNASNNTTVDLSATVTAENASTSEEKSSTPDGVHVLTANGEILLMPLEYITKTTNIGAKTVVDLANMSVVTADGVKAYDMAEEQLYREIFEEEEEDSSIEPPDISIDMSKYQLVTQTVVAEGTSGNFVFIGKGWGHGVGISQYAARDLAKSGYTYQEILALYFPNCRIDDYRTSSLKY